MTLTLLMAPSVVVVIFYSFSNQKYSCVEPYWEIKVYFSEMILWWLWVLSINAYNIEDQHYQYFSFDNQSKFVHFVWSSQFSQVQSSLVFNIDKKKTKLRYSIAALDKKVYIDLTDEGSESENGFYNSELEKDVFLLLINVILKSISNSIQAE